MGYCMQRQIIPCLYSFQTPEDKWKEGTVESERENQPSLLTMHTASYVIGTDGEEQCFEIPEMFWNWIEM